MKQSGKIIKGVGGKYTVLCDGETVTARARGVFRHEQISPEVGDNVTVRVEQEGDAYIEDILERKNLLIRPPMANLDYMFITASAAKPAPILATLDKLSAICVHADILPVFVITKCDLDAKEGERIAAIYRRSGFTVFTLSAEDGEGIEALRLFLEENLPGKTAAFAGASGIGKSTLLNALFPELSLATGGISERIARGKHTTRHVELFSAFGGLVADTPGFSMLDFMRFDFMSVGDLPYAFPELVPHIGRCRYTKCTHLCEEGCAIVEAVKNGEIETSRHESYVELYTILKDKKEWKK
ncbi:MAG: ribosome small subunit-dependent GTPase A [Clostridia bacterium]|nr:ribosome small subunit-dependent GTPase A [Clostridia bacterium]